MITKLVRVKITPNNKKEGTQIREVALLISREDTFTEEICKNDALSILKGVPGNKEVLSISNCSQEKFNEIFCKSLENI